VRIALITSRTAYPIVKEVASKIPNHIFKILPLSVPIASLVTTKDIAQELVERYLGELSGVDLIILPGLVIGSAKVVEDKVGIMTVKGTKYAGDLPEMIKYLDEGGDLSAEIPADEVIRDKLKSNYVNRINQILANAEIAFSIRKMEVPTRPPPLRLIYEYTIKGEPLGNMTSISEKKVEYLMKHNIDSLIIGVETGADTKPEDIKRIIADIRDIVGDELPIGIDPPYKKLDDYVKSLGGKVDIIMNLAWRDVKRLYNYLTGDEVLVVIPESVNSSKDVIVGLRKALDISESYGLTKIIVDPLIRPPLMGLFRSIEFLGAVESSISKPIMAGLSNVYELMDADTHSIIALLTSLFFEAGVSLLLITESSRKAKWAVAEAAIAREMAYRAFVRRSPPLNVGKDLLIVKEKTERTVPPPEIVGIPVRKVIETIKPMIERKFYVKIYVNKKEMMIIVDIISDDKIIKRFKGKNALGLGRAITRELGAISPEHAMYIGYELSKAELALKLDKSYIQDEPLFTFNYIE
jgi:dihydropteroate synthase-like protein